MGTGIPLHWSGAPTHLVVLTKECRRKTQDAVCMDNLDDFAEGLRGHNVHLHMYKHENGAGMLPVNGTDTEHNPKRSGTQWGGWGKGLSEGVETAHPQ